MAGFDFGHIVYGPIAGGYAAGDITGLVQGKVVRNFDCALFGDYHDQDEVNRYRQYFEDMAKAAVDFEGTMSTYMGDTDLKVPYFEYEHGKSTQYMKKVKDIFDPKGIMNPGKKFRYKGGSK